MQSIEFFGPCNDDGSSHPFWRFEIEAGCQRVLIAAPAFVRGQATPRVWGFKNNRQVEGRLVENDPATVIIG
jgi:hypothetical protein